MCKLNLIIFNEDYWFNNLIYTQNITPLILMSKQHQNMRVRIISFTSILMFILKYKQINVFKKQMKEHGITIYNLPILFVPSRIFIMRWFLFPYLFLNVFLYMICINIIDILSKTKHVYILRSYVSGLIFTFLYYRKKSLIFDPRTDYILEHVRIQTWKMNSLSCKLWINIEKIILKKCRITLFISTPFLDAILYRHRLKNRPNNFYVIYNPVDFSKYVSSFNLEKRDCNFVYSGSLGNWNKLENYLDIYKLALNFYPESVLYILTNSRQDRVNEVLNRPDYIEIRSHIIVHYNLALKDLAEYYKKAAFGLQIMDSKDSRLGVKVVEYIAAGLIPIVSDTVLGAKEICESYNVGVVISNVFDENTNLQLHSLLHDPNRKTRILKLSELINIDDYSKNLYKIISILS